MYDQVWWGFDSVNSVEHHIQAAATDAKTEYVWLLHRGVDYTDFDLRFVPDRFQRNMIHAWPAHNNKHAYTTWLIPAAALLTSDYYSIEKVFHDQQLLPSMPVPTQGPGWHWHLHEQIDYSDFDFTWLPDVWDWDITHAFAMLGTDQLAFTFVRNDQHTQNSTKYHASNLKFVSQTIVNQSLDEILLTFRGEDRFVWSVDNQIDYTGFDFTWLPEGWDKDKLHCFCIENKSQLAYTFLVNPRYYDKSTGPVYHASNLKFVNQPIVNQNLDEILHTFKGEDRFVWSVDSRIDYANFDFTWLPEGWDKDKLHCFCIKDKSQLAYTFLVNPQYYDKSTDPVYHPSNLEMQDHLHIVTLEIIGDGAASLGQKQRFVNNMEDTLRAAIRKTTKEWLWVTSDCCDYSDFDFSWLPDLDQKDQVHCWPSGTCEKGETFLVNTAQYRDGKAFKFNFDHAAVSRKPWPVVVYKHDSLAEAVKSHPGRSLYTIYQHYCEKFYTTPEPCLWNNRPVIGMNRSNSVSMVPRDCVVEQEIYEYPHLIKQSDSATDAKMKVIFIHSGESQARINYVRLRDLCPTAKICSNNPSLGRLNGYQTAAHLADADWFIAVFAKCWVLDNFENFDWVPDYWQKPKHYIFMNHNTSNDLVYGHMAPIAYNTQLLLKTTGGLDITMAQPHAVVPIKLSSVSLENDPWLSWRTAFREVIKLLQCSSQNPTVEAQHRLWTWENHATGPDAKWILRGARDARDYYERCGGDIAWLAMSAEWAWCEQYFMGLYSAEHTVSIT
jgi:hypothetical protein